MTGMTGTRPSASGFGTEDLLKLFPALLHGVRVRHVRHGAAGGQVGQDDGLVRRGEDVCGLGHEVHAAEDDGLGVRPGEGGVGQLEGVAHEVGVLDDLVALVEVAQDHCPVAQLFLGGADPYVQLGIAGELVLLGQLALAGGGGRGNVRAGGTRAVGGGARERLGKVILPRALGQCRAARAGCFACSRAPCRAFGLFARDQLDGCVDAAHGVLLLSGSRPGRPVKR